MTDTPSDDFDDCAREPIRVPGVIQPHGVLLVLDGDGRHLLQASANAGAVLGAGLAPGVGLDTLKGGPLTGSIAAWLATAEPFLRMTSRILEQDVQMMGHRTHQGVILEIEPDDLADRETLDTLYPRLQHFLQAIDLAADPLAASQAAAREVRRLTGFDRVLIYRFDDSWNGTVIAEDGNGVLPSYLDLRFPAADIPSQARDLYRRNRLRLIPDAGYGPVPIVPRISPVDGNELDLSFATLRSISPVHLEYMRNMGTAASMSVSLVVDGRLWGLIVCHHKMPRRVSPGLRAACDFIGQFLAQHLGAWERSAEASRRIAMKRIETRLLARLAAAESLERGLADSADAWLDFADATGVAVILPHVVQTVGQTPPEPQLRAIAAWLREADSPPVFATDRLPDLCPAAADAAAAASGLLTISISQINPSYIIWLRTERVGMVTWAGEPERGGKGKDLHPRSSFARWQEQVRRRSAPWRPAEVEGAGELRNAIQDFVLRRAEERAALTDALQRSNKELESFSYSVSHDLRAPFRHIVGYAELLGERAGDLDGRARHYLDSIKEAALSAGRLVDDLLKFSQLNRAALTVSQVDMGKLVAEVRRSLEPETSGRNVVWQIGVLPDAWGDPALLRQALLNLIANAVKYTRGREPAVITVFGEQRGGETIYAVRDNGIGFDMAYVGKLFGVFQRLHRMEDFEGTGIGLALTKRVIDRHAGWIRAEGVVDEGATFTFGLPEMEK